MEQDQVSMTEDNYEILAAGSASSSTCVGDQNWEHDVIKNGLVKGMGQLGHRVRVVGVRKNSFSGLSGQGRIRSFGVFNEAVWRKNGGNPNVKFAWYGGSKKEICDVITHGFACVRSPGNGDLNGRGVYLSPAKFPMDRLLANHYC